MEEEILGKLPPKVLEAEILGYTGALRPEVLIGPGIGEDAALVKWPEGKLMVVSSDPIVGAQAGAGQLLVHINSNDIACKGGDPAFLVVTLIIPKAMGKAFARSTMQEIDKTCKQLNISVVGGHTEITDRYERPVVVGTMLGTTQYLYDAKSIEPGDVVIMTKHAGLEGMSIIAHDRPDLLRSFMSQQEIDRIKTWSSDISILEDSRAIRDLAKFMHDPTEGGFLGGFSEMSVLSDHHIDLDVKNVPLDDLTERASKALGFDPLKLISSGVLLAVVCQEKAPQALERLKNKNIQAKIVAHVTDRKNVMEVSTQEELWRILALERR